MNADKIKTTIDRIHKIYRIKAKYSSPITHHSLRGLATENTEKDKDNN
jgi:hypothetical protein